MKKIGKNTTGILVNVVLIVGLLLAGHVLAGCKSSVAMDSSMQVFGQTTTIDPCILSYDWLNEVLTLVDECNLLGPDETEVTAEQSHQLQEQGALILDVRTKAEWTDSHIPGATLIPVNELEGRIDEVPEDVPVIVQCRSGRRSQQGLEILENSGFSNALSMKGGIQDWIASGFEVEAGE